GLLKLRKRWKAEIIRKNPSLQGKTFSLPVVVPGLTAAVSYIADMFIEPGDTVIVPDLHWPNYRLIVEERKMAAGLTFPTFRNGGYNVAALESLLREAGARRGKAICILNFPNNPTGYSLTLKEADALVSMLVSVANDGTDLLIIADDAYFGLQYEEDLLRESVFARLVDAHPNILAVKADGPTKEDYVWSFRLGFVSFGGKGLDEEQHDALAKKLLGVIRSSVSSSNGPTQYILLKALDSPGYDAQKAQHRATLAARYAAFKRHLASIKLPDALQPLPFNSGYFMSFECVGISAEMLRIELLEKQGIGCVSLQDKYLRVAFSSVEEKDIPDLINSIVATAKRLAQ
ncbi:MAG: aminotransferase class I/II-fold pyridoxal phosphate-dependent enzyme, partial [Spirochaetaceae bacterium]|nr:aminotransferase class I/II-fold pyridoxal phosphate-dependent enzyme [Spirochaetaceae bacterium]